MTARAIFLRHTTIASKNAVKILTNYSELCNVKSTKMTIDWIKEHFQVSTCRSVKQSTEVNTDFTVCLWPWGFYAIDLLWLIIVLLQLVLAILRTYEENGVSRSLGFYGLVCKICDNNYQFPAFQCSHMSLSESIRHFVYLRISTV